MNNVENIPSGQALVGYKRPPVATRFKKGRSGNPSGRPRRERDAAALSASIDDVILQEVYRTIEVREGDRIVKMPLIQAVVRSLGVAALKGSLRAQLAIAAMTEAKESRIADTRNRVVEAALDYKLSWKEVFAKCDREGKPRPEPVPHPDEIQFDARAGAIVFNGPKDEFETAEWDTATEFRDKIAQDLAQDVRQAKRARDPIKRADLRKSILVREILLDRHDCVYPDIETRRQPGFHIHEWRERQAKLANSRRARLDRVLADDG